MVTHHVSVMVIQAGGALRVIDKRPDEARVALEAIGTTGRLALTDMRRMLGILGEQEASDPTPGLDRLDELLDQIRSAGLDVDLVVDGDLRPLDPGLAVSAYRIVQEALTNSLKHAGGGHARVVVRYAVDALEITIADERGAGAPATLEPPHEGRGLIGMRERATMLRGTLVAHPTATGFVVTAHLPIDSAASARMSIRVLLVDDQALVRTGFRMILADEEGIEVVGEAANGREAVDGAPRLRPDVVVMDIRMPIMDGVEATRRLTASAGEAPRVLVLTTFDTDEHVVEALRAGASGFLLKDVTPADFVAAIRVVASGEALIAPSVTRRLLERFVQASPSADEGRDRQVGQLTEREREVLELVAQGLSNREIADRLVLAEPTVKTHVSHLLLKLDLRDRAQLVVLAYESGIVRPGSRPRPDADVDEDR